MDFKIRVKGKVYDIRILERGKDGVTIKVGGKSFDFNSAIKENKNNKSISEFGQEQKVLLKKEVKASLAGLVSEIFVKEGEMVKQGQRLLTLLAMKMENEIITEQDGKIKKIMIKTNQTVREGEILVIFE
ncbi:MAG: acetyl-CoA carboxylase biotin carboxyl carrier protein subunit [Candidatus Pacebacteria bacterium]|nr:acetyl-CoA carboxylase biotin carboxyl carrier protein subunit [Candidatus Paceibacterota bacterium]